MGHVTLSSPFGSEPIDEVPLARSPLVRVLAQVRFPKLVATSLGNIDSTVGRVAERLRDSYPILNERHEAQITIGPDGVSQTTGAKLWLLRSADDAWQITIGEANVSLATKEYTSRVEFAKRLTLVLTEVANTISPPYVERLGVRYTNRIQDSDLLLRIHELVRPETLGGLAVSRPDGVVLAHTMSESLYQIGSRMLRAQWGLLPPGVMVDPTLPALSARSWILDLDSFVEQRSPFDADAIASATVELAKNAYRYFRWVVTEKFLVTFGGEL